MKKTTDYSNKYVKLTKNKNLRKILEYPVGGLASHWMFQGMLYMDTTELIFKLSIDIFLMVIFAPLLHIKFKWPVSIFFGFMTAHTLNFLFNGQVWGVLKHYGWASNTFENFQEFTNKLTKKARAEKSIFKLLAFGSLSRNSWRESSDLDARILRQPGFWNGIRVCWFVVGERSRALFAGFPLDIYILDSEKPLEKLRADEEAINLLEQNNMSTTLEI